MKRALRLTAELALSITTTVGSIALGWSILGPNIQAQIAAGIPLRYADQLMVGMVNLVWWSWPIYILAVALFWYYFHQIVDVIRNW